MDVTNVWSLQMGTVAYFLHFQVDLHLHLGFLFHPSIDIVLSQHYFGVCQWQKTNWACPLLLYSVLVSVSVFMTLSTVFHSINSPNNSAFLLCSFGFNFAILVLSAMYLFTKVSLSPDTILCGWLGLKHQLTNKLIYQQTVYCLSLHRPCFLFWTCCF